jgi:hypothetical protein
VGCQVNRLAFFHSDEDPKHPTEMSAPPPTQNPTQAAGAAQQAPSATPSQQGPVPSPATLVQAAKLAMAQDNPIRLDYYAESCNGKAFMGEDGETKEKMLVKSSEEFTSMIQKTYKVAEDYIVLTENSIYIVNGKLQKRRIQANTLRND